MVLSSFLFLKDFGGIEYLWPARKEIHLTCQQQAGATAGVSTPLSFSVRWSVIQQ